MSAMKVLLGGFRVGSFIGVPLVISPTLFIPPILAAIFVWPDLEALKSYVISYALAFATVTVHEYGHVAAAKLVKTEVSHVTLFILGGVASIKLNYTNPWKSLFVSVGGPAVNVAIMLTGSLIYLSVGNTPEMLLDDKTTMLELILRYSAILMAFNLIPIFPLDGGRVLQSVIQAGTGLRKSLNIMRWVSFGLIIVLGIIFITQNMISTLLLLVIVANMSASETRRALLTADLEDRLKELYALAPWVDWRKMWEDMENKED